MQSTTRRPSVTRSMTFRKGLAIFAEALESDHLQAERGALMMPVRA